MPPPIPELPFATDVLEYVVRDLEASRALQQRCNTIEDALFGASVTVAGLLSGLALSTRTLGLALLAVPLILILAGLDVANRFQFTRASTRNQWLEGLVDLYVIALRETGTVRPQALGNLRREIDWFVFGVERRLESPGAADLWRVIRTRARSWFFVAIAVALIFCAFVVRPASSAPVCVQAQRGVVAKFDRGPSSVNGPLTIVPCEAPQSTTTTSSGASTSTAPKTRTGAP
jgi:hypothetical protein